MEVSCKSCPARFAVPDDKVRGRKVKIVCKRCGNPIVIDGTGGRTSVPSVAPPPGSGTAIFQKKPSSAPAPAAMPVAKPAPSTPGRDWAALESPGLGGAWREPAAPPSAPRVAPVPQTQPLVQPPRPGGSAMKRTLLGGLEGPAVATSSAPAQAAPAPAPPAPPQPAPDPQQQQFSAKRTMLGIGIPAVVAEAIAEQKRVAPASGPREVAPSPAPPVDRGAAEADAGLSEPEWTVALSDEHHEEMRTTEVVECYVRGSIDHDTFIWADGMEDWKRPWEIPLIAAGLASRGLAPPAPEASAPDWQPDHLADAGEEDQTVVASVRFGAPASSRRGAAPPSSGTWREPGRLDDPHEHAVGFDDVTVSLDGRKAQELLRQVADDGSDFESSEDAPTRIHQSVSDNELMDGLDEPTLAGNPFSAEARPLSSRPAPALLPPADEEKTSTFDHDKLTGARNEDSVLFSLDKLSESARAPLVRQPDPSLLHELAETRQHSPPEEVLAQLRPRVDDLARTRAMGGGSLGSTLPIGGDVDDLAKTRHMGSDRAAEELLGPKSGPPPASARLAPPPAAFSGGTLPLTPAPVPDELPLAPTQPHAFPAQQPAAYPAGQSGNYPPAQQSGGYPAAQSGGYPAQPVAYPPGAAAQQAPAKKKSGGLIWLFLLVFVLVIACALAASYLLKVPPSLYGPNGQPKLPF